MEQVRHHHTLHGTRFTNWRMDQKIVTSHHWIRETKSSTWVHLATERKPGHRLETKKD